MFSKLWFWIVLTLVHLFSYLGFLVFCAHQIVVSEDVLKWFIIVLIGTEISKLILILRNKFEPEF